MGTFSWCIWLITLSSTVGKVWMTQIHLLTMHRLILASYRQILKLGTLLVNLKLCKILELRLILLVVRINPLSTYPEFWLWRYNQVGKGPLVLVLRLRFIKKESSTFIRIYFITIISRDKKNGLQNVHSDTKRHKYTKTNKKR